MEEFLKLLNVTSASQKDRASLMNAGRHNVQDRAFMSNCKPSGMLNKKCHRVSLQHSPRHLVALVIE